MGSREADLSGLCSQYYSSPYALCCTNPHEAPHSFSNSPCCFRPWEFEHAVPPCMKCLCSLCHLETSSIL